MMMGKWENEKIRFNYFQGKTEIRNGRRIVPTAISFVSGFRIQVLESWILNLESHRVHNATCIQLPSLMSSVCGRWSLMYASQPGCIGMSAALPFV